jgi:hypothetical protein
LNGFVLALTDAIAACGRDELAKKEADIAAREEKLRVGQKVLREEEKKFFDEKDTLREEEMGLRQAAFKLREGETLFRMQLDAFNAHQTLLQSRSGVDSPKPFDTTYTSHVPSEFAKGLSLSTSNLGTQSPSHLQAGSQSASKSGQVPQVLFADSPVHSLQRQASSPGGRPLRTASPSNGASRGESPSGGATDYPDSRRRLSMSTSDIDRGTLSALERGRGSPMNLSSFMNRIEVQTVGGAASASLGVKDPPPQLTSVMSHASDFELHGPLPTMYPSERVGSGGFAAGVQQSFTPGRSYGPLKATSLEEDEVLV